MAFDASTTQQASTQYKSSWGPVLARAAQASYCTYTYWRDAWMDIRALLVMAQIYRPLLVYWNVLEAGDSGASPDAVLARFGDQF